jgi:iron uptake system component EfeO
MKKIAIASLSLLALVGCQPADDSSPEDEATLAVKAYVTDEIGHLHAAAVALRDAAPAPDDDGWNVTADADAVAQMRVHWSEARVSYERIEGAIAVLFPDLDAATDERYDGFLEEGADTNLFDGEGVIGVHGIERILWADAHPPETVEFEMALAGYQAAAYPADAAQAAAFKDELAQRLVDDVAQMQSSFEPLALDPAAAYSGVVGSMAEQLEKVALAATGEDESRYAEHTLADMRANLEGGRRLFEAFVPWLESEEDGDALITEVEAGFGRIEAEYARHSGGGVPPVPDGWSAEPTDEQRDTPYGELFTSLEHEADPEAADSLVSAMIGAAEAMDIPVAP